MKVHIDTDGAFDPLCVTIETDGMFFHITASSSGIPGIYVSCEEDLIIEPTARSRVLIRVKKEAQE